MYVVDEDQLLFVTERGEEALQIVEFLKSKEEVALITLDQKEIPGRGKGKEKKKKKKGGKASSAKKKQRKTKKKKRKSNKRKDEL